MVSPSGAMPVNRPNTGDASADGFQASGGRVFNFSPGPAALPLEVLEEARQELLDYRATGMSVMEMSHRSPGFMDMAESAETDLRTLLRVPENYRVLFVQGGATMQFAAVPLNLLGGKGLADYVETGHWSRKAVKEAGRFCDVHLAATSAPSNFDQVPPFDNWQVRAEAAYLHICTNETISGVQFREFPAFHPTLVADMSSDLLSRPIDVARFGLIYAGAQKNIGPAGLTVVIVRDDLLGRAMPTTPSLLDYEVLATSGSMFNTPPTFAWYMAGLMFKWLLRQGGIEAAAARNAAKAAMLYDALDASNFYQSPVAVADRSLMNVPFILADPSLDSAFLAGAKQRGLMNLKGHRSVGGMRASLYNAVPTQAVAVLVEYMAEFERECG